MYRVIKFFTDLEDSDHAYHEGDIYPRDGLAVSEARIKELSTNINRRGTALIEKVEKEPEAVVEEVNEPSKDFMNPPEEVEPQEVEEEPKPIEKPRKKRGRPRNDSE